MPRGSPRPRPVLLVHSAGPQGPGEGSRPFAARLRADLGPGYRLSYPRMPEPDRPSWPAWREHLARVLARVPAGTPVIGHSLGGTVLLKLLAEAPLRKPLGGLFLAAMPWWGKGGWDVPEFVLPADFPERLPPVPFIGLYRGSEDEVVPRGHLLRYAKRLPQAKVREVAGADHALSEGLPALVRDLTRL